MRYYKVAIKSNSMMEGLAGPVDQEPATGARPQRTRKSIVCHGIFPWCL